jgi:hypothetical protein
MRIFHLDTTSISPSIYAGGDTTSPAADPVWWAPNNRFRGKTAIAAAKKIFVKMCHEPNILAGTFRFALIELLYPNDDEDDFFEFGERIIFEGTKTTLETPRIIEQYGAQIEVRAEYTVKRIKEDVDTSKD